MTRWPTGVEPVNDTMRTPGWASSASPATRPAPVSTLTTPSGMPGARAVLGEHERGERRELGGLEHDGVAGGDGREDLPDRHLQRVVPRGDRADDAHRLAPHHARCGDRRTRRRRGPRGCARHRSRTRRCRSSPGTSNSRVSLIGLPVWAVSTWAYSSARSAMAAASAVSAAARSPGVARPQSAWARVAAATATSTSPGPARSAVATTSPVAGLTTSCVSPGGPGDGQARRRTGALVLRHRRLLLDSPRVRDPCAQAPMRPSA